MTAAELIKALQAWPLETQVLLDDPDTGWILPVHIGSYGHYCTPQVGMEPAPYIWADYTERLS